MRRQVKKNGPNHGRFFWGCGHGFDDAPCNFFAWDSAATALLPSSPISSPQPKQPSVPTISLQLASRESFLLTWKGSLPGDMRTAIMHQFGGVSHNASGIIIRANVKNQVASHLKGMSAVVNDVPPELLPGLARIVLQSVAAEEIAARIPFIWNKLFPYQREGVQFAINHFGKCLFGDEMGLGKSVQALGLVAFFRSLPLLIICPKSLRSNWLNELLVWKILPCEDDCFIVSKGSDIVKKKATAVIISYDLVGKLSKQLQELSFAGIILDESHYLKNVKAARTKAVTALVTKAREKNDCILLELSGTPALSRPMELLSQLQLLGFSVLNLKKFGARYCAPTLNQFSGGLEYKGADSSSSPISLLSCSLLLLSRC